MSKNQNWLLEDVHTYRCNRSTFTVYVGGDPGVDYGYGEGRDLSEPGVEHRMADRFQINMETLSSLDRKRPITIMMSSCGGLWEEGMQMMTAILHCPNPVTVVAMKWARSMTSLIPLAADQFLIRPPAQYMYHFGTYSDEGIQQLVETNDLERRKQSEVMLRVYVNRLKEQGLFAQWTEQRIKNLLLKNMRDRIDVWLSADTAVAQGFADGVDVPDVPVADVVNEERRHRLLDVLRRPVEVVVKVS